MKIRLLLKTFDNSLLKQAIEELLATIVETDCQVSGTVSLPMEIKRFCVLRSPHVDKKSREHFEIRIYRQFFDLEVTSPENLNLLLKSNLPAGVNCSLSVV